MNRKFFSIAMIAMMLIAGTNVYLANQQNKLNNELNLDNLEANGMSGIEKVAKWVFVAGIGWVFDECMDYCFGDKNDARINTFKAYKTITLPNGSNQIIYGTGVTCSQSGSDCSAKSFQNRINWDDGSSTNI